MGITSTQIRMARAALDWSLEKTARKARLHRNTIHNIEVGKHGGDTATLDTLRKTFARAGVEFIEENGGGEGVRFKRPAASHRK